MDTPDNTTDTLDPNRSNSSEFSSISNRVETISNPDDLPKLRDVHYLGQGGMGEIYKAVVIKENENGEKVEQEVVIKFAKPMEISPNTFSAAYALDEAELTAAVPGIAPRIECIVTEGAAQILASNAGRNPSSEDIAVIMEYIDGKKPEYSTFLDDDEVFLFLEILAEKIDALFEHGILHRDIKPDNLLIVRDQDGNLSDVKVIDFGISCRVSSINPINSGSWLYSSPERFTNNSFTLQDEIYALGVVFCEIYSGKNPFDGLQVMDLIKSAMSGDRDTLLSMVSSDKLRSAIARAMPKLGEREKDNANCYKSATEFSQALRDALSQ